ncbi:MAG: hypothetical protein IT483_06990 [Gammaproteobacteria bacterium]|nr:hypothetical protein [Gammaproteobacteria bacterium]
MATGQRYLDDLTIAVDLDGERLLAVEGLALHASVVRNNGHSIGALTGVAQGNSGIEAPAATRLYEAWADWRYANFQHNGEPRDSVLSRRTARHF